MPFAVVKQGHHHNSDQAARQPDMMRSICGRRFGCSFKGFLYPPVWGVRGTWGAENGRTGRNFENCQLLAVVWLSCNCVIDDTSYAASPILQEKLTNCGTKAADVLDNIFWAGEL